MQDGIGADVSTKERASEDAASIDGKVTKLGQTEFTFTSDMMAEKKLNTVRDTRFWPQRNCQLTFVPAYKNKQGINLVLIAYKQNAIWGHYSGQCQINEELIKIDKVFGFYEEVSTRW